MKTLKAFVLIGLLNVVYSFGQTALNINGTPYAISGYDIANQDYGTFQILDGGNTIRLSGNTWKKAVINYTITSNTILEFDIRVTGTGEIQGISFDTDNGLGGGQFFQVAGTQVYQRQDFNTYTGNDWVSYRIPVGEFFTGQFANIIFLGDADGNPALQECFYRNVKIFESTDDQNNTATSPWNVGSSGIFHNGNVGIGTASPEANLKVVGNGTIGGRWNPNNSYFTVADGSNSLIMDSNELYGSQTIHIGSRSGDLIKIRSIADSGSAVDRMVVQANGNVGIGTLSPDEKLAVNGKIHAQEVRVDLIGWPDYVFTTTYDLPTLEEIQEHITEKGHLPNMPSAEEVEKNGVQLGEMNKLLLEKIEELTLHVIQLKKEIDEIKNKN